MKCCPIDRERYLSPRRSDHARHVRIKNTRPDHLDAVLAKLEEAGAKLASATTGSMSTCAGAGRNPWMSAPRLTPRSH